MNFFIIFGLFVLLATIVQVKICKAWLACFLMAPDPWIYKDKRPLGFWILISIWLSVGIIFFIIGFLF